MTSTCQTTSNDDPLKMENEQMLLEEKAIFNIERKNDKVFNEIERFFIEIEKIEYED